MSAAFGTQAFQQSRHARRIYVGGFPPNYGDEEALKFFLNSVIAKGLGEPSDNSYVLSIYVNQKKCFAFVELRAIELATACLDLDGIIYKKVVLKVLRANEYKPELIPPSMVGAPITLDLSSFSFGIPTSPTNEKIGSASTQSSLTGNSAHPVASSSGESQPDARLDSVIQFASLSYISAGCISIIGYPFDDRSAPNHNTASVNKDTNGTAGAAASALTSHSASSANLTAPAATSGSGSGGYTGLGCTQAPKKMRNMIRKYKFGMIQNPEYDVDLKNLKFIDVGDVQAGKSREETKHNLSAIVAEVVQRRAVPFVVGGSSECAHYTALGVISATARPVGMVVVSAQLDDLRILEDPRLCERHSPEASTQALKYSQGQSQVPNPAMGIAEGGAPGLVRAVSSHSQSLVTTLPGDSVASPVSVHEPPQHPHQEHQQSQQSRSELDSPFGMDRGTHCGGRYVRFAAQGIQCTTQQAENVISKGGHVVWLGRDIRNQSAQCTLGAHLSGDNHFAALAGCAVPHVYTLMLFREALRCAAGKHAVSSVAAADVSAHLEEEVPPSHHAIHRAESQDFAGESASEPVSAEVAEKNPMVSETPPTAGASDTATPHVPAGAEAVQALQGGVVVSIDMGVVTGAVRGCGYITGSSNSATGLTVDEILDMVMIAGADPNVLSLDISEFSPDAEDSRSSMLLAQMFYQFSLGVASRPVNVSSAAKSLGHAMHPAVPGDLTGMDNIAPSAGGAGGGNGGGSFMYGGDATAMRVPFRLTVHTGHERSSEQLLLRDLGSLSRTPKFYQEVSSGSMEAFTSANTGQSLGPTSEKPSSLPYVEVDHRFSSMDCLDHTGISMSVVSETHVGFVGNANKGVVPSPHSVSSGSTNTNQSNTHSSNTNIPSNTSISSSTTIKPPASPNHYVASPPTASNTLAAGSTESFSKHLYPSGMPPQYVNHSQSQRSALQSADAAGMFTGMVRTSPAGTPVVPMRRLSSASSASSPPLGHRGINTTKSLPGPGMMGMSGLYPPSVLARNNSTGSQGHLTPHQQLYAQQQQQMQHQQQQLQQHHALYGQQPLPPQQQRGNQPPSSYRTAPPPAPQQGAGQGQGYVQQRARYEAEQTWGGDRVDVQNRYAPPAPSQRQQLMHAQHQQQQLYRLQQHQQHHHQQHGHNQPSLDDRSSSPHLYLSPDFLDLSGERHSNALSSPSNSGSYGDRLQQGGSMHRPTSSTGSDLSSALAGLGVGGGSGELAKGKSSLLGGNAELSGFDETVEMYEYRILQQQQAQAQQLRGRAGPPQNQGVPPAGPSGSNLQARGGFAPMYSVYSADSLNFSRSASENLTSNLSQDLMGSLSSSSSLLFSSSPHTPHTQLTALSNNNPAGPRTNNNVNTTNSTGHTSLTNDPVDTSGDFLSEHYNQFS